MTTRCQNHPRQAVILAGGRGTRLAPLTDTCPKPMIEFHGRPFLAYLIDMLKEQGFERVLLLLGYLPEVVSDFFGDGSDFGVEIEYSVTPVDDDTGSRIQKAADRLDPTFLLAYCDNYWPMSFEAMWAHFNAVGAPAMVTVYDNADAYTKSNLRVESDLVAVYDKSRTAPDLRGVDIGFIIMRRELLSLLPEGNVSFEASLYPQLVAKHMLGAYVTGHRYYSVGSHERLSLTERFLARSPAIILDRDGVLNAKMPKAEYVRQWSDWHWIDGALESIAHLTSAGYNVIIVTNQAGIARGVMREQDLADIHARMIADIEEVGGKISAIYYCPHGWNDGCACRKPKPGMLFQAQSDFDLDLSRVYFIGDDDRDAQAGNSAGCLFRMVSDALPLSKVVSAILKTREN